MSKVKQPYANFLTRDMFELYEAPLEDDTYKAGDLLTYDGDVYSKASLASGDDHTESYAVVYEDVTGKKGTIVNLGGVRESLLSADYQGLSDDDKKAVRKELEAKKIFIDNI